VEALPERKMDVACVQKTRCRGSGCRLFGAIGKRDKLFWMGSKAKSDGVGIFVAEKWVDSVVSVERQARAHARTHARTHTHTHTRLTALSPGPPGCRKAQ